MSNLSDFIGGPPSVWVTGTTYAAGVVVWSPSDYQYYMRKSAGAGSTDPSSDATNWQPTGGRAIKSIQRGTISLAVGAATATASLSPAVNPAKTELRFTGFYADTGYSVFSAHLYLTNGSTVTATKANATNVNGAVSFEITETY